MFTLIEILKGCSANLMFCGSVENEAPEVEN